MNLSNFTHYMNTREALGKMKLSAVQKTISNTLNGYKVAQEAIFNFYGTEIEIWADFGLVST